jgi:hypothetical protein
MRIANNNRNYHAYAISKNIMQISKSDICITHPHVHPYLEWNSYSFGIIILLFGSTPFQGLTNHMRITISLRK